MLGDTLVYYIEERERVRKAKEAGMPKPWSSDWIFQETYFCNVRREDDKVTKFIRKMYSPYVGHPLFVHNIILSRFLNWPDTLETLGYIEYWDPEYVSTLKKIQGKVWGSAYVVSTCGRPIDKVNYLTQIVMPSIEQVLEKPPMWMSCKSSANRLQEIEGISTFMAGQIVADLKNTLDHPLTHAPDWWTFALPGPGSRRGMDWLYECHLTDTVWREKLPEVRAFIVESTGLDICSQDTQNNLCEFSKYMKIKSGTGRTKRYYSGI
jgi:hypothetical protein